jgi:predicted DNA binding CopG/RHH family protein
MKKTQTDPDLQDRSGRTKVSGNARLPDYIDWSKAERARFPNLEPSTTAISIRLPLGLLEQIKIAANKRDVPYQSLVKTWLSEKVEQSSQSDVTASASCTSRDAG